MTNHDLAKLSKNEMEAFVTDGTNPLCLRHTQLPPHHH
jgi:hypothetical protein